MNAMFEWQEQCLSIRLFNNNSKYYYYYTYYYIIIINNYYNNLTIKHCDKTKVKTITIKNSQKTVKILKGATTFRRLLNVIFKSK